MLMIDPRARIDDMHLVHLVERGMHRLRRKCCKEDLAKLLTKVPLLFQGPRDRTANQPSQSAKQARQVDEILLWRCETGRLRHSGLSSRFRSRRRRR